jgi:hypothetical protein
VKGQVTAVECGLMPVEAVFLAVRATNDRRTAIQRLNETKLFPVEGCSIAASPTPPERITGIALLTSTAKSLAGARFAIRRASPQPLSAQERRKWLREVVDVLSNR